MPNPLLPLLNLTVNYPSGADWANPRISNGLMLAPRHRGGIVPRSSPVFFAGAGQVAEWSKAHAWEVCRRGTVSR
ncbi:MAG: hypothetical protein KDA46_06755, partial [Parvularculaceae bacterium]|nr:hypothetical protein [Parvularculaceae bacterium]